MLENIANVLLKFSLYIYFLNLYVYKNVYKNYTIYKYTNIGIYTYKLVEKKLLFGSLNLSLYILIIYKYFQIKIFHLY